MTATINASTSSGVVITPDNSGNILLQYNGVAAPAFSAYGNANQSGISANTWTKVQLNTEDFDTASCFDTSTYRFTPNVAGYYQITGSVSSNGTSSYMGAAIYKNGAIYTRSWAENSQAMSATVSMIIYLNGSTDYIELYGYISSAGTFFSSSERGCNMSGCLLRGA